MMPSPYTSDESLEDAAAAAGEKSSGGKKLSYREQRELGALPGHIEALEQRQQALEAQSADPAFYSGDHQAVQRCLDELGEVMAELDAAMERWAELEDRA